MRERNGEQLNGSAKRGPQLPLASLQRIASLRVPECQQCEQVVGNLEIMCFLKTGNPRPREGTDGLGLLGRKWKGLHLDPGFSNTSSESFPCPSTSSRPLCGS